MLPPAKRLILINHSTEQSSTIYGIVTTLNLNKLTKMRRKCFSKKYDTGHFNSQKFTRKCNTTHTVGHPYTGNKQILWKLAMGIQMLYIF